MTNSTPNMNGLEIAVISMSGRFPAASNIKAFWENLKNGVESISFYSHQELASLDLDPELLKNPDYVKTKGGGLEDKEFFDPAFFGYTPREAEIMDPQMRIFHECAWHALEEAGYDSENYDGLIGLYAGAASSAFWEFITTISGKCEALGYFASGHLNNKDFLSTQIAYKLNLKGPVFSVQTACSTSLVAIHLACQGILNGECNMALAGGITINIRESTGFLYQEGMINSPDGHCRAFDAKAKGTINGEGVGVVLLKSLADALADADYIYAVIKGTAINNDGLQKVGYTAPSIEGQAEAIRTAQQMAEVEPESIGYIEAHGTATPMGDPVEIAALKLAFNTGKKNYCGIGSVKTNIGHLDAAAGAAGFIKTVLALKHRLIPPSLHFETPNPKIDFKNSPFYVNNRLNEWKSNGYPRRAGVSSFGIGGTNAHVVLEEFFEGTGGPAPLPGEHPSRQYQLILLSAKTETALDKMTQNLAEYFETNLLNPGQTLADAAYTLQVGRKAFPHRRMVVCSSVNETIEALTKPGLGKVHSYILKHEIPRVVFMFSGQGSQYVNMGLDLYQAEPMFREEIDHCFEILKSLMDYDIKEILYPSSVTSVSSVAKNKPDINQTEMAQPVLFIIEYSLARLLMKWGITPDAMIGHSIGEYAAACLAGVFSLEDALKLVVLRGRLMQEMPGGKMLGIPLSEEKLRPLLDENISLAAVNSPSHCVVSGEEQAINLFDKKLREMGYETTYLHTSHAFHSKTMDPILPEFEKELSQIRLNSPKIPYVSNLSGNWISASEAANPGYWAKHLRRTVRFADGIKELQKKENPIFIEVGPGKALSTFVRQHEDKKTGRFIVNLVRHPKEKISDVCFLLNKIGQLWLYGIKIDWPEFYSKEKRHRIPLPAYPFERQIFKIGENPYKFSVERMYENLRLLKKTDIADWFYIPSWKRSQIVNKTVNPSIGNYIVFMDDCGLGSRLVKALEQIGQNVTIVETGKEFTKKGDSLYTINPMENKDYDALFAELRELKRIPCTIAHLGNVTKARNKKLDLKLVEDAQCRGFHSLIAIAQAVARQGIIDEVRVKVVTNNMQEVTGGDLVFPEKAAILGAIKAIPLEYTNISCRSIDISLLNSRSNKDEKLINQLLTEITDESHDTIIAYRDNNRWTQIFEPIRLESYNGDTTRLRKEGVYLVTGGLGGIGLIAAEYLVRAVQANLILIGRSAFPPKDRWEEWISANDKDERLNQKIRKLKEFEQLGSEVLVFSADVTSMEQMQEVIFKALDRFGRINGVIHSAGLPDGELIQLRTREKSESILAAKVKGTLVLDRIFKNIQLDFFVLFSSCASIIANMGQAAYSAANAFLDAFALHKSQRGTIFTVSIDWDRWKNVGMAVIGEKLREELSGEITRGGITAKEGIEAFRRILGSTLPQVAVKCNDLRALIEMGNAERTPGYIKEIDTAGVPDQLSIQPQLTTEYAAPGDKIEERLIEIFQEFFGIEKVGIFDDFFELGGDSLKAITITSHIKKEYPITLNELLVYPTVKEMASVIREKTISKESAENLYEERLLSKLECIEKLNKGNNDKNIFIIHPLHGMVNQYKNLAVLLESDYNVYGIQARGLKPGSKMAETPKDMVNDYLKQILAIQKGGPYIIAGYCIGVHIAYELVRLLEALNYPVERLILFNTRAFFSDEYLKLIRKLEYWPGFVKKIILFLSQRKFKKDKSNRQLSEIEENKDETNEITDEVELHKERFKKEMEFMTERILSLDIVKAPILAIKVETNAPPRSTEEHFSKMTKSKATVVEIPGTHDTIFDKPYVENLAGTIQYILLTSNPAVRDTHDALSKTSNNFLEYVEKNSRILERSHFEILLNTNIDPKLYVMQAWPTFIDKKFRQELELSMRGINQLIKSLPNRFFNNDVRRISRYFGLPSHIVEKRLSAAWTQQMGSILCRGDLVLSSDGFKFLEINAGNLGGMELPRFKKLYKQIPLIARFIEQYNVKPIQETQNDVLIDHLIDTARAVLNHDDDPFNMVSAVEGKKPEIFSYINDVFRERKHKRGMNIKGKCYACDYSHVEVREGKLYLKENGERVKIMVEFYSGEVPDHIMDVAKNRNLLLLNGPVNGLVSNKLNFVLLSENYDSPIFLPEEQQIIKNYIPWTRKVVPGETTFKGEKIKLEKFLYSHREQLVLKPIEGYGGYKIFIGKHTKESMWNKIIDLALTRKGWLVQEYVHSVPFCFQSGESGCSVHDGVWGAFLYGSRYAGCSLRVMPRKNTKGVVNIAQGAAWSVVFEVDDRLKALNRFQRK